MTGFPFLSPLICSARLRKEPPTTPVFPCIETQLYSLVTQPGHRSYQAPTDLASHSPARLRPLLPAHRDSLPSRGPQPAWLSLPVRGFTYHPPDPTWHLLTHGEPTLRPSPCAGSATHLMRAPPCPEINDFITGAPSSVHSSPAPHGPSFTGPGPLPASPHCLVPIVSPSPAQTWHTVGAQKRVVLSACLECRHWVQGRVVGGGTFSVSLSCTQQARRVS